jgi:ubiquinone/menaquinone biosynthesis C-methylase UbiE
VAVGGEWEEEAENWVRWARTEGHDAYWAFRRSFFETVVRARGHRTVSVDLSPTLLGHARDLDPGGSYLRADGAALPLADASCDLVVSYNALMDIADMSAAVGEAARVLCAGGRFCVCVTHPMSNTGRFDSPAADATFVVTSTYFGRRRFEGVEERDGLTMHFRGWSYALEDYARALERAGFLIEIIREPVPETPTTHLVRWCRVPLFLHLRAVRL